MYYETDGDRTILTRTIKNIYLLSICGTAMASLASLLRDAGYSVRGTDQDVYPPMSTFLASKSIEVFEGFDIAHLDPPPDLIIIGNVLSRGNEEVEAILERGLHYASLPEALKEFFLRDRYSIVVTGTHGKTTTSSMIAWALECNDCDPSFLIGGLLNNFQQGAKLGKGEYFVIEGDEYDTAFFDKGPKFMHYMPDVATINNVEFDHADIYRNLDEIKISFRRFINIMPRNGLLVVSADDTTAMELAAAAFCPVQTFAIDSDAEWTATELKFDPGITRFALRYHGKKETELALPCHGAYNVRNALATIAVCRFLGIEQARISEALLTYRGVKKRMELRSEVAGIHIFDDFAHHPTAIAETLSALRTSYPARRIWALYEPRTATARRNVLQHEYAESLAYADCVVVAPVFRPDKAKKSELFSVEKLIGDLRERKIEAFSFPSVDAIVDFLGDTLREGDLVVTLNNGDFHGIHDKLINALERKIEHGERRSKIQTQSQREREIRR